MDKHYWWQTFSFWIGGRTVFYQWEVCDDYSSGTGTQYYTGRKRSI